LAGFVETLTPREKALEHVASVLGFPRVSPGRTGPIRSIAGRLLAPLTASEDFPPFTKSTRDGYAAASADCLGASPGSPAYLSLAGEVPMGEAPSFSIGQGQCALIHTGGILPEGADGVVMMEDAESAGGWIEIKKAVQKAENTVRRGEEFYIGDLMLKAGSKINFKTAGLFAMAGVAEAAVSSLTVGVISTGDEIAPPDTKLLPPGRVRDVNASLLHSLLTGEGFLTRDYGIARDEKNVLSGMLEKAMDECDVVVISGGSSVSMRDHCSSILEELPDPGLLIRGILMSPGKPTLVAGTAEGKKLVMGLPGHPYSCFVSAFTVLLPLLNSMVWGELRGPWRELKVITEEAIFGIAGIEEFIPCVIENGRAVPRPVKSSFSRALAEADGLFHIPASMETVRPGEEAEVWLW
jgi:molybdopterin molybdotransferase